MQQILQSTLRWPLFAVLVLLFASIFLNLRLHKSVIRLESEMVMQDSTLHNYNTQVANEVNKVHWTFRDIMKRPEFKEKAKYLNSKMDSIGQMIKPAIAVFGRLKQDIELQIPELEHGGTNAQTFLQENVDLDNARLRWAMYTGARAIRWCIVRLPSQVKEDLNLGYWSDPELLAASFPSGESAALQLTVISRLQNDLYRIWAKTADVFSSQFCILSINYDRFSLLASPNGKKFRIGDSLEILAGIGEFSTRAGATIQIGSSIMKINEQGLVRFQMPLTKNGAFQIPVSATISNPDTGEPMTLVKYLDIMVEH